MGVEDVFDTHGFLHGGAIYWIGVMSGEFSCFFELQHGMGKRKAPVEGA